ncbi:MAG TPA: LCP family protein [Syntrophomonadaceae bacterium]|nr:LCP family protein [Syntrophomonadaceae bacterium]
MKTVLFPVFIVIMVISLITYGDYRSMEIYGKKPEIIVKREITASVDQKLDAKKVFNSRYINLAFLGLDKTREREETLGCFRTDTIIIMRIDLYNNNVYMLSIPRDTYVFIPVINRMDKINHAFPYGGGEKGKGFDSLIGTVESFLGIKIDHYIGMDMEAIAPVVDAAGGVKMDVDLDYHENGCSLIKGQTQMLNGEMAYHYVCYRCTSRGDIDRIERQQKFLKAFLGTANNGLSMKKAIQIYNQFGPMIHSDMTFRQIMSLACYLKKLNPDVITGSIIEGNFMNMNGISYWNPDMQQKQIVVDRIFPESLPPSQGNN